MCICLYKLGGVLLKKINTCIYSVHYSSRYEISLEKPNSNVFKSEKAEKKQINSRIHIYVYIIYSGKHFKDFVLLSNSSGKRKNKKDKSIWTSLLNDS